MGIGDGHDLNSSRFKDDPILEGCFDGPAVIGCIVCCVDRHASRVEQRSTPTLSLPMELRCPT